VLVFLVLIKHLMEIKKILTKANIKPDPLKDQFFLKDKKIIEKMIKLANLNKKDVVLEIGAGVGNLTKEIAKKVNRVIAFEIDSRFEKILSNLPQNVEVHFENAWSFVQLKGKFKKKRNFNKIVASLPYSLCEPLLHNLTFLEYEKAILLIPAKFVKTIKTNPIFASFFKINKKTKVEKTSFYPSPKTNSCIVDLAKLPDPIKEKNLALFLKQYLYQHEKQKVKNSLREGLIKFARLVYKKQLTKNQARTIINQINIEKELLKNPPNNARVYQEASKISSLSF